MDAFTLTDFVFFTLWIIRSIPLSTSASFEMFVIFFSAESFSFVAARTLIVVFLLMGRNLAINYTASNHNPLRYATVYHGVLFLINKIRRFMDDSRKIYSKEKRVIQCTKLHRGGIIRAESGVFMTKKDVTTMKISKKTHSKIVALSEKMSNADYGKIVDISINCLISAINTEGWHVVFSQADNTLRPVIGAGQSRKSGK